MDDAALEATFRHIERWSELRLPVCANLRIHCKELQSALTAAQQRLSEQETLLAERNRQNAACWAECDGLRSRIYALRDSLRDESLYTAKSLRAAIDAAMGAKEGM